MLLVVFAISGIIMWSSPYSSAVAQTIDSTPKWISVIISWHEKGLITSDELQQSLEYLDKEKIIDLDSSHFKNNVLQNESSSKYEIQVTKGEKHIVPLDKIRGGGPPPDGIPSIDNPKFVNAAEATIFQMMI